MSDEHKERALAYYRKRLSGIRTAEEVLLRAWGWVGPKEWWEHPEEPKDTRWRHPRVDGSRTQVEAIKLVVTEVDNWETTRATLRAVEDQAKRHKSLEVKFLPGITPEQQDFALEMLKSVYGRQGIAVEIKEITDDE